MSVNQEVWNSLGKLKNGEEFTVQSVRPLVSDHIRTPYIHSAIYHMVTKKAVERIRGADYEKGISALYRMVDNTIRPRERPQMSSAYSNLLNATREGHLANGIRVTGKPVDIRETIANIKSQLAQLENTCCALGAPAKMDLTKVSPTELIDELRRRNQG